MLLQLPFFSQGISVSIMEPNMENALAQTILETRPIVEPETTTAPTPTVETPPPPQPVLPPPAEKAAHPGYS
jgi:hypothetical protein